MTKHDVDEEEPMHEEAAEEHEEELMEVALELIEVHATMEDSFGVEDETQEPLAVCQICMEVYGSKEVIRHVCGASCGAEICESCMIQHLTATVYSYYPGVLPKMRCPMCLTVLHKSQWSPFVESRSDGEQEDEDAWINDDHSHILDKYVVLCEQMCGFRSPCCHVAEYTHLPQPRQSGVSDVIKMSMDSVMMVPALRVLFQEFCYHRVEAEELCSYVTEFLPQHEDAIINVMLNTIDDEERRATLLLYRLQLNPNTYTLCCRHAVCFQCKAGDHHGGKCRDFIEDQNVLECPGCHVTLVKVDGCDSVACLCGHHFHWPYEAEKQRLQRKQLAPSDSREYKHWRNWASLLDQSLGALDEVWRARRLDEMLHLHGDALRVLVRRAARRARLNLMIETYRDSLRKMVQVRKSRLSISKEAIVQEDVHAVPIAPAA